MIGIRARLRALSARDGGFTLVEVLVAMMLFTIVSISIVGALIAIRTISASANLRQTAQNLATGALDKSRIVSDITTLNGSTTTQTVGNRTFTITQSVAWVGSINGSDSQCSSGSGNMIARSVTVSVTWNGMGGQNPVKMSTVVAPDTRLNTAGNGSILVSVKSASGAGLAGVTANAKPAASNPNGATTVAGPFTTDADGCVFIPGVTPGNYDVTISKTGGTNPYVGSDQTKSPLTDAGITVSASNAGSAPFQIDQSMKYTLTFAGNLPSTPAPLIPTGITASFTNIYGVWAPASASSYFEHPYPSGYRIVAGKLGPDKSAAPNCTAVDPNSWPDVADPNDPTQTWSAPDVTSAATPGGSATVTVDMGGVTISGYAGTISAINVSANANSTDPGCSTLTNYTINGAAASGSVLALPYGYWQLKTAAGVPIPAAALAVDPASHSRIDVDPTTGVATVVLDPRVVGPTPTGPTP